jgi:hypothetical protein
MPLKWPLKRGKASGLDFSATRNPNSQPAEPSRRFKLDNLRPVTNPQSPSAIADSRRRFGLQRKGPTMQTNIIVKIKPPTPTPKNPVNPVNPVQNPYSTTRLEIESKPNRSEPPLAIQRPRPNRIPNQKRIRSGSKANRTRIKSRKNFSTPCQSRLPKLKIRKFRRTKRTNHNDCGAMKPRLSFRNATGPRAIQRSNGILAFARHRVQR